MSMQISGNTAVFSLASSSSQEKTNGQVSTLSRLVFPLTEKSVDRQGNTIQLWSIPESSIVAVVQKPDGSISYIPSQKIKNPLNPEENTATLHNRLLAGIRKAWDYAFKGNGGLAIWPRLIASGWQEAIPKPNGDITGIARLARGRTQGEMCAWFYSNGYQVDKADGTQIDVHLDGQYAGSFNPESQQDSLRNFLTSQRGSHISFTVRSTEMGKQEANDQFGGRGIVFRHPKDHNQTTFNIDCTTTDGRTREEKGGHHIDIRSTFLKEKEKVSTKESYVENRQARLEGRKRPYDVLPTPARLGFTQLLQQTGLIKSYNSSHSNNPMPEKGMTGGDIGGVACKASYIENLFDDPSAPFIDHHYFCFPALPGGEKPFIEEELKQIIRELATGIYEHGALPFFSLHFQEEGTDLFPVIHPNYANTLVGRVIGMLDYIMKGYLNGGVYQEEFIDSWHKRPNWKTKGKSALEQLIEFTNYCKNTMPERDQRYISLAMMRTLTQENDETPEELRTFTGFKNAFRIIAKQEKIEKEGAFLHIESDFDVFYDINPTPAYQQALNRYTRKHGKLPPSYVKMEEFYSMTASRIHEHMHKMPLCQKYFSMLSVISFFSSYFSTLKQHRKQPCLSIAQKVGMKGCPPLFPHLPVIQERVVDVKLQTQHVLKILLNKHRATLEKTLNTSFDRIIPMPPFFRTYEEMLSQKEQEETAQVFTSAIWEDMCESAGILGRRLMGSNENLHSLAERLGKEFLQQFLDNWRSLIFAQQDALSRRPTLYNGQSYAVVSVVTLKVGLISRYLREIDEEPDQSLDLLSLQYTGPILPSERDPQELKTSNEVVGGCGLEMKTQQTEPSLTSRTLWRNNRSQLLSLEPEKWHPILQGAEEDPSKYAFRLFFTDLPIAMEEDFSWMEQLLVDHLDESKELFFDVQKAIMAGDRELFLEKLQSASKDLKNMRDSSGRTLLHHAVLYKDPFYVQELVQAGFSLRATDEHGHLPLHYAAMFPDGKILRMVYRDTLLNAEGVKKDRPLSVAILHQNEEAVQFFLSRGAKPAFIIGGYTDLHSALHEGNLAIIHLLLDSPDIRPCLSVNSIEGGTPLMLACELGDLVLVQRLVDMGADPAITRRDGVTALEIAIRKKAVDIVAYFVAISTPSFLALEAAAQEGTALIIEILRGHIHTFKNASDDTAIHVALIKGNCEAALALVRLCQKRSLLFARNVDGNTPLRLAAGLGDWATIEALQEQGIEIEDTELDCLLRAPYHPLLKQILMRFFFPPQRLEELILIAAKARNHRAISEVLVPLGANLERCEGPKGWKLLHYLAKSDGIFLFRKLIERDQNIYHPLDQEGNLTLAAIAARSGSRRILGYLLKRGVLLEQAHGERSLLSLAIEGGVEDLVLKSQAYNSLNDKEEVLRRANEQVGTALQEVFSESEGIDAEFGALVQAIKERDVQAVQEILCNASAEFLLGKLLKVLIGYEEVVWLQELVVNTLESKNWNPNISDELGRTPLFYALLSNNEPLVSLLLQRGADVEHKDKNFFSPLAIACTKGSLESVKALLQEGADPNQLVTIKRIPAIYFAVEEGHTLIVRHLLSNGADPSITCRDGTHLIHLLAEKGYDLLIRLLVMRGISVYQTNEDDKDARHFAASAGNTKTLALLVSLQEEPLSNEEGISLLRLAGAHGREETVRWLFEQGVIPSESEQEQHSSFTLTAMGKNSSSVLPLFEPYKVSESPVSLRKAISAALQTDNLASIKRLYPLGEIGVNLDIAGNYTGIHLASEFGALHSTQWLLSEGADPSLPCSSGETALELAAANSSWQQFRSLLEYGQPPLDKRYLRGETLMHIAARSENASHLTLLIADNAPLDMGDNQQCTPLYRAAEAGHEEVCRLLLASGANPSLYSASGKKPSDVLPEEKRDLKEVFEQFAHPIEGETSLHRALRAGSLFALQFFLSILEPEALLQRDREGKTALGLAREIQNIEMIDALLSAGAEE